MKYWQGAVSRITGNGELLPCADGSTEEITKIVRREGRKRITARVRLTEQSEKMHSDPQSERNGNSTAKTPVQQRWFIVTHSFIIA